MKLNDMIVRTSQHCGYTKPCAHLQNIALQIICYNPQEKFRTPALRAPAEIRSLHTGLPFPRSSCALLCGTTEVAFGSRRYTVLPKRDLMELGHPWSSSALRMPCTQCTFELHNFGRYKQDSNWLRDCMRPKRGCQILIPTP